MIHISSFVKRQTGDSHFSHPLISWADLRDEIEANFDQGEQGYREGVWLVPLDPINIMSGVVVLEAGQELTGVFEARREGECPRQSIRAVGAEKQLAKMAFAVLYASTVLKEDTSVNPDGSNELSPVKGNWECVSLNASPVEGEMPINPMTHMHNHFGSSGGSDTNMTDAEFVALLRQSFEFWKDKSFVG